MHPVFAKANGLCAEVTTAAIEVHRLLGPDYLESVYQEALGIEFKLQGIPAEPQKPVAVTYKGHPVREGKLDFLVDQEGCRRPIRAKQGKKATARAVWLVGVTPGQPRGWKKEVLFTRKEVATPRAARPGFP